MWMLYVATVTQLLFTLAKQQNSDSWVYLSKVCFCNYFVSQLASFLEKCLNSLKPRAFMGFQFARCGKVCCF